MRRDHPLLPALLFVVLTGCPSESDVTEPTDADLTEPTDADSGDGIEREDLADEPDTSEDATPVVVPPPSNPLPWTAESTDEACGDGVDNDGNTYGDCDDFACSRNPSVTVCGDDARWETSPARCSDNADNDGDGLIDCDDPDCAENPFHDACPAPLREVDCVGDTDTDGDGVTACADVDCVLGGRCGFGDRSRVLFDQSLDETAAVGPNSDWMFDGMEAFPSPSNPGNAEDWSGSLSSFAFALWSSGEFVVETRPPWGPALSFGDDTDPFDLAAYDVLLLFEPSRLFDATEKQAVIQFVQGGGGVLLVANHLGADRDGNGVAAPQAFNDLLNDNPVAADPFGFLFDEVDESVSYSPDAVLDASHPVIDGAAGTVSRIGFHDGCTAHLTGTNPGATALLLLSSSSSDHDTGIVVGAATVGAGRVVFVTDSAIANDGSSSHGDVEDWKDSWNDASEDNATLFINAIRWLAGRP